MCPYYISDLLDLDEYRCVVYLRILCKYARRVNLLLSQRIAFSSECHGGRFGMGRAYFWGHSAAAKASNDTAGNCSTTTQAKESMSTDTISKRFSIPNTINISIVLASTFAAIGLLKLTDQSHHWYLTLIYAILFSFINNTIFALLHESVHGQLNSHAKINTLLGIYLSAFFPTGYHLQKYAHLSHHVHNRSYHEQFDYIRKGDNQFIRYLQWYGILTGLYWLLPPASAVLYLCCPNLIKNIATSKRYTGFSDRTGATAMMNMIEKAPAIRMRLEILYTIGFQLFILHFLDIQLKSWLICYAAFAINWSSLQYADHAWSKLDATHGAWNLKVNVLFRWFFLNYHYHHAHHRNPNAPWIYLPKLAENSVPKPSFWKIYRQMWLGPKPIEQHEQMHQKVLKNFC